MNLPSVETTIDSPASRLGTRLSFFIAGFGVACWAPIVPFVKARIQADEAELGLLLLCLGLGSVIAMPAAAGLSGRIGSRGVILMAGVAMAVGLPLLAFSPSTGFLAVALLFFGGALGLIDVAANIHGTEVQNAAGIPLMSNFHGLYSVGGLVGAAGMTGMLAGGLAPLWSALLSGLVLILCVVAAAPRLLRTRPAGDAPFFVIPRGITILLGVLAFIIFLVEGAMLDWSAVLLSDELKVATEISGAGYALFALAMTIGRFTGDWTIKKLGNRNVLLAGSLLTSAGIAILVLVPDPLLAMSGFLVIGFGAANLVPVLFTAAGVQNSMPKDYAIAAVSIMGYAGVLCGPALIGFLAKAVGLLTGFGILGAAVLVLTCFSSIVARIGK